MKVEQFVVCDSAREENGKLIVDGIMDAVGCVRFPCENENSNIAFSVRFDEGESENHIFKVTLMDPNGKDLMLQIDGNIENIKPPCVCNLILKVPMMRFKSFGKHTFYLSLDKKMTYGLPFMVQKD